MTEADGGLEAALTLVDAGDRRWDSGPSNVRVGAVRMGGWQVHSLDTPESFAEQDSYLIKLNYELALEPEVTAPPWFEVGFQLSCLQTEEQVAVLDALPRSVFEVCEPTAYGVGKHLSFARLPHAMSHSVDLPALSPFVDAFGVGSSEIRWRYLVPGGRDGGSRGVRPGSYLSWIIALVPAGCVGLNVQLTVRYDMDPEHALGCLPATSPATFRLALIQPNDETLDNWQAVPAAEDASIADTGVSLARIFISYAHDNDRHVDSVLAFAEFLCRSGLDVHLDRWDLDQRRDWYQWASAQIRQADFVIIVASPMCRRVGDGEIERTRHRGLQSELALVRELLHSDRATWLTKLLPVVLPGGSVSDLPLFLQPQTADHYLVEDFTVRGAEDLIRAITSQPPFQRPTVAEPLILPPRLSAL